MIKGVSHCDWSGGAVVGLIGEFLATLDVGADVECGSVL